MNAIDLALDIKRAKARATLRTGATIAIRTLGDRALIGRETVSGFEALAGWLPLADVPARLATVSTKH